MSESNGIGEAFITTSTGTSAVDIGGIDWSELVALHVTAAGANIPAGTTLIITDGEGIFSYSFAIELPTALLASYTGPLLSEENLALEITYGSGPCTAKLSNALSSGSLAINVGYM
jgi:hypothetical protein